MEAPEIPTVLIVEDDEEPARILNSALRRVHCKLAFAQNGKEALDWIADNGLPSLMVTDVIMPGMSGFELLSLLREKKLFPPTIMLTGKTSEEDILEGLKLGVLDYISKPFSPLIVTTKIKSALERITKS